MDKAKKVASEFVSKDGHHDTTIHETINPAVQKETVRPTQHEEINTAINRETHQDHYRQKVQPVVDQQRLPETHTTKLGRVENREYDNRNTEAAERAMRAEAGKFRDEKHITDTTHTTSHAPTVTGEQVHHHVHETVQPVIHKETIQPSVVHTTQPIHEIHHSEEKIHPTTTLPTVNMSEFQKKAGASGLSGTEHTSRSTEFAGCPEHLSAHSRGCPTGSHSSSSSSHAKMGSSGITSSSSTHTEEKPSLLDRLNPMKDADGDGKKGFFS